MPTPSYKISPPATQATPAKVAKCPNPQLLKPLWKSPNPPSSLGGSYYGHTVAIPSLPWLQLVVDDVISKRNGYHKQESHFAITTLNITKKVKSELKVLDIHIIHVIASVRLFVYSSRVHHVFIYGDKSNIIMENLYERFWLVKTDVMHSKSTNFQNTRSALQSPPMGKPGGE